jgi:hypothetical protein
MGALASVGVDPSIAAGETELKGKIKKTIVKMLIIFFTLIRPFDFYASKQGLSCSQTSLKQQALFQGPLPISQIMTLRLSTILSSHLNCRWIGLLNRSVVAPTPAMVMSTSIPDKNRTAGKEKQR